MLSLLLARYGDRAPILEFIAIVRRGRAAEDLHLPAQLRGEGEVELPLPGRAGISPEAAVAVAVVVPSRVVEDGIEADALHGHALPAGRQHLAGDVAQPARPGALLGAGPGHDQGQ